MRLIPLNLQLLQIYVIPTSKTLLYIPVRLFSAEVFAMREHVYMHGRLLEV